MAKKIVIRGCFKCPNFTHVVGGYVCKEQKGLKTIITKNGIPSFCPLEENK